MLCSPLRSLLYWFLVLGEVKLKTHTQEQDQLIIISRDVVNQQSNNETVNLAENYAKHTFPAPWSFFKSGFTIDLLLFKTINVHLIEL